jgi:hypothetical protein
MLPTTSSRGGLIGITLNSSPVSYNTETIKGMEYAIFAGTAGDYVVSYLVPGDNDGDGFAPPRTVTTPMTPSTPVRRSCVTPRTTTATTRWMRTSRTSEPPAVSESGSARL